MQIDVIRDKRHGFLVIWVNSVVISVNDAELLLVLVVHCVTIALVGVQVDDHDATIVEPLFHILTDEGNVWVDAEPATTVAHGVMIPTTQVDAPALLMSNTGRINRALRRILHRFKHSHTEDPRGDEEDGELDTFHDLIRIV